MLKGVFWVAGFIATTLGAVMVCAVAIQIAQEEEMRVRLPDDWRYKH